MREISKVQAWVVYEIGTGMQEGLNFVCTQDEWKAVETCGRVGTRIIKKGIIDENVAEKLVRGTLGNLRTRLGRAKTQIMSDSATP